MRLPPYPQYKQSGQPWVPELPMHWDLASLRWLSRRYAGGTPDKNNSAFWEEGDIPWLNSGAVNDGYITEPSAYITREGFLGSSAKWIPKGALVMALAGQGKTKAMVAQLGIDSTCNQSMAAIIPTRRIQARYLYWWLAANYSNIRNMAGGEARDGLNLDLLGSIPCPVPSDDEQRAISAHLDRETATIDALVAKKRTLVERLAEKRTALISRTVTRGLPPDAAHAAGLDPHPTFKPSGIDWLSGLPDSWTVTKVWLERVACNLELQDGNHGELHPTAEDYVPDGIPFVMANDIVGGRVDFGECKFIERPLADTLRIGFAREGDVLLTHKGTIGRVGLVQANPYPYVMLTPQVTYYRCLQGISNRFLFWSMQGAYWQDQMLLLSGLGTTRAYVGLLDQKRLAMLLPPLNEQVAIAAYLDAEAAKLDRLMEEGLAAIERLQEYRATLIAAAVTGKVDLRGAVA